MDTPGGESRNLGIGVRCLAYCKDAFINKLPGPFCALYNLLHPLLEDRVPSGLADDQVSPLHHHNTDEEGRMAGELHYLPLLVGLKGEAGALDLALSPHS